VLREHAGRGFVNHERIRQETRRVLELNEEPLPLLALPERGLRLLERRYVYDRENQTLDPVIDRSVGSDAQQVVSVGITGLHFHFGWHERLKHVTRLVDQIRMTEAVGEVGEWPAAICVPDAEDFGNSRRVPKNSQVAIEEECRDIRGLQEVLKVARELREFLDLVTILLVEGLQLLVD
jgi:hypothetical protein